MTTYNELLDLIGRFLALVDAVVRLPPGPERRSAFREIRIYGERIDSIAANRAKWHRRQAAQPSSVMR